MSDEPYGLRITVGDLARAVTIARREPGGTEALAELFGVSYGVMEREVEADEDDRFVAATLIDKHRAKTLRRL